eukprot:1889480-Rhodomonas_salina.4
MSRHALFPYRTCGCPGIRDGLSGISDGFLAVCDGFSDISDGFPQATPTTSSRTTCSCGPRRWRSRRSFCSAPNGTAASGTRPVLHRDNVARAVDNVAATVTVTTGLTKRCLSAGLWRSARGWGCLGLRRGWRGLKRLC